MSLRLAALGCCLFNVVGLTGVHQHAHLSLNIEAFVCACTHVHTCMHLCLHLLTTMLLSLETAAFRCLCVRCLCRVDFGGNGHVRHPVSPPLRPFIPLALYLYSQWHMRFQTLSLLPFE